MQHSREDYNRIQDPAGLIPEDEPVFLLRGQDIAAPAAVEAWAAAAQQHGADHALITAALKQAAAMRLWQFQTKRKLPDL